MLKGTLDNEIDSTVALKTTHVTHLLFCAIRFVCFVKKLINVHIEIVQEMVRLVAKTKIHCDLQV